MMWRDLIKSKHLLLVDLHSSGVSFYLAKEVSELPSLDFSNIVLLEQIFDERLCRHNSLADAKYWQSLLQRKLAIWQLRQYKLIFLLSHQASELEKRLLGAQLPFWQTVAYISRDYFYNFYLLQKRNFSATKVIISCFTDCIELSLFQQDVLLAHETVTTFAFAKQVEHFLSQKLQLHQLSKPECVYLFTHNQAATIDIKQLANTLQTEVIEIKSLP